MCHQACIRTMKDRFQNLVDRGLQVTDTMLEYERPLLENRLGGYVSTIHRHSDFDVLGMIEGQGLCTLGDLETRIREDIVAYAKAPSAKLLEEIFFKIQIWLGHSGTFIFVRGRRFNWNVVGKHYQTFVTNCLTAKGNLYRIKKAGPNFDKNVTNLKISQISVHIHFWTYATLKDSALPIFNNRPKNYARLGVPESWVHIVCFWNGMRQILHEQHLTNMNALDRHIILFENSLKQDKE